MLNYFCLFYNHKSGPGLLTLSPTFIIDPLLDIVASGLFEQGSVLQCDFQLIFKNLVDVVVEDSGPS